MTTKRQSEGMLAITKMIETFVANHPDFQGMRLETIGFTVDVPPLDADKDGIRLLAGDAAAPDTRNGKWYKCKCNDGIYLQRQPCSPPCKKVN